MTRLVHISLLLLAALCLGMAACNDGSCYENGSSLPLATFYINGSQQTIPGITIMGIGAPGDSMIALNESLKEAYLPLRANVGTTSYLVGRQVMIDTIDVLLDDTLTLTYQAVPYFHSSECGAMYNFEIKDMQCTFHYIDSVDLITTTITNSHTPALRIYFHDLTQ